MAEGSLKYQLYQVPGFNQNSAEQTVFFEPMSCILPPTENQGGLYLGNIHAAQDIDLLLESGIRAVLTVAVGTQLVYDKNLILYHQEILADDVETFDLQHFFNQCFTFIETARKKTSVLVHCFAGVSRSTSIVLAYLMKYYSMDLIKALDFCRSSRGQILPNGGFMIQLQQFENQIKNSKTPMNRSQNQNQTNQISKFQQLQLNQQQSLYQQQPIQQQQHLLNQNQIHIYNQYQNFNQNQQLSLNLQNNRQQQYKVLYYPQSVYFFIRNKQILLKILFTKLLLTTKFIKQLLYFFDLGINDFCLKYHLLGSYEQFEQLKLQKQLKLNNKTMVRMKNPN